MGIIIEDSVSEFIFLITTVIVLILNYFHNSYKYWESKGVPTIRPRFPLGNTNIILPRGFVIGVLSKNFYDEFKRNHHKFGGIYLVTQPNLVITDPDYIKDILTKDFHHFVDRGFYHNVKKDHLSGHLFAIDGADWKNLRIKLTPTFTSGKMKMMFNTVVECCNNMTETIGADLGTDIDIKEVSAKYTTDVIGSCAFGINCNSFKYPDAEFRQMGIKIFETTFIRSVKNFFMLNMPNLSLKLGVTSTTKEVSDFFTNVIKDTVKLREDNQIRRNDFLQILIDMKSTSNFTIEEMAAQVFLFFIAGFDTSSTAMAFGLYELARNQQIQDKLRDEIRRVLTKYNDEITYESLNEMTYLGQVIDETLRMYPSLPTLNRRCVKDYILRDTDIVIEKGTPVLISTLGLHMDPEYFPEPEKFDPERFSDENKKLRHPFVFLPFGDGPRNCIGLRFGLMQSKIGIINIIKNFKMTVSPKTKSVEFDPYVFLLKSVDTVYLKAEKI